MVKKNQYDITVDATVIDVSKKPDGVYRVRTTGAEFEAFATAGSYYKNDIVLVQVPNGDYKNPKFILGRKSDIEENRDFNLKFPFDDFIGLMHLDGLIGSKQNGMYWANWPETPEARNELLHTRVWRWTNKDGATMGNTRLGIEVDWQTFLAQYHPLRGTFGFRIIVQGNSSSTEVSDATSIEREYYFTNADMYGNPYAYKTPYAQQKVLDVSEFLKISDISIYFYQDFNFADNMNVPIWYEEKDADGPFVPENILFNNLKVYLGVSAEDRKEESTYLYSYNALSYSSEEKVYYDEDNDTVASEFICNDQKFVFFTWVHYESDGTFSVIKDATSLAAQRNKAGKKTHIYWYRYNYDEDITDKEKIWDPAHADLEKDWNDSLNNSNYESAIERYGGAHWTFLPYATDDFAIEFTPRGDKSREKFKVVVQHDGSHTTSDELIFKNTRDIEAEILSGAKNDTVVIKTFKLKKVKDNSNRWTGDYEAVEDGSINAFHVYDENNKILINDDDERFDEHYYYLQVQVRNEVTNKYEMLTTVSPIMDIVDGKEQIVGSMDTGSTLAWAFPREYTMIATTSVVDTDDAKKFGIDPDNEPVRYQNFYNATIKFKIASTYNNRYLDNTVGAIITQNGKNHHIEKHLMFGRAEGLGHEYLPVIEIIQPVGDTYLHAGTEFIIGCCVYNKDGTLYESPSLLTMTWRELSGKAKFHHYANIDGVETQIGGYQIGAYLGHYDKDETYLYTDKYTGYRSCCVSGTLEVDPETGFAYPPIFEVTVNGAASYPLVVRKGFMVCSDYNYKQKHDITVPARVEFKSDGADPIFYSDYFEVAKMVNQEGSVLVDYDLDFPEWKINNENIFHLESITTPREFIEQDEDGNIITTDRGYVRYKLVFNDGKDAHPQWLDEYLDQENYTYLYYDKEYVSGDSVINVHLAQAIAFDRNYYASSLVNDWDGVSLTWDEENGAILSTMIAAGTKDNNNKFTGVMMGDWHAKGDESLDTPGLYGYNKGAQTFGFKTDGTGFIGASGKGRIEFDGTEALISNPDRSCYINLNPVNLNDRLYKPNNSSFSENFIYCKVKKTDNIFDSISNAISSPTSWAKKYFDDDKHDYFVVDPNYGVLTTGGVIARYGALGNWMISNQGLYQKTPDTYMYLGFDETNMSYAQNWYKMKTELLAAKRDLSRLDQDRTSKESLLATTQKTLDDAIANEPNQKKEFEDDIAEANAEIQANTLEINAYNTSIGEKQDSIDAKLLEIQNLGTSRNKAYEDIGAKQANIKSKEEIIFEQQSIIRNSGNEYAELLITVQNQQSELSNLKTSTTETSSLIQVYEQDLSTLNTDKTRYTNQENTAQATLNSLKLTETSLLENISVLETEIQNLESLLGENNVDISTYTSQAQNILTDLGNTDLTLKKSSIYISEQTVLKNELAVLENTITPPTEPDPENPDEEIENPNAEQITILKNKIALYDQLIEFTQTIEELELNNQPIQSSINSKNSSLEETLGNLNIVQDDIVKQELIIDSAQQALSVIETSYNLLQSNVQITKDSFDIIYQGLNELHTEVVGTSLSEYPENIVNPDITEQKTIISKYIDGLKEQSNYLNNKITSLNKTLEDRKTELSALINNNADIAAANNIINEKQKEIEALNAEIDVLNDKINTDGMTIKTLEADIENLRIEIADIESNVKNYENKNAILINHITSLNNSIAALQKNIDNLKTQITLINIDITAIQKTIELDIKFINEKQQEIKNEIIAGQIEYDFTPVTLYISDNILQIEYITNIAINAIDSIIFSQSTRYAIYVATSEPNVGLGQVLPYFSVSWDGTMFARKGKIANTWEIDDYALTYKKNNDIMYIGTEEYSNSGAITEAASYQPLGRAVNLTDSRRWAISASDQYDQNNPGKEYLINFGVSLSGELYAQLGTIAGWKITKEQISSPPKSNNGSYIILDSMNNIIRTSDNGFMIDGSTGTLSLRAGYGDSNNSNVGLLYLAEYLLMGRTVTDTLSYTDKAPQATDSNTSRSISGVSDDYGWGHVSVGGTTITTASNNWITNLNFSLDGSRSNYLQFLDSGHEISSGVHPGVILATGNKQGSTDNYDVATVFYPVKTGGILGLDGHRWNLVADSIDASLINAGGINGTKMYENFERVATQVWVTNALADLWNAIKDISDKAGQASKTSHGLSITKVELNCYPMKGPLGWTGVIIMTRGNGSTITSNVRDVDLEHEHNCRLYLSGNTLKCDIQGTTVGGTCEGAPLGHSHPIDFTFSSGTVSCTIGGANFSNASSTSDSFNVAATSWYRDRAYGNASVSSGSKSVTIKSLSGRTLATISCQSIYSAGYYKGLAEGKKSASTSSGSSSKT